MEALRGIVSRISWLKIAFVYGENAHAKNSDTKRKEKQKKKKEEDNEEEEEENIGEESGEDRTGALTVTQIAFNGLIPSVQLFMVIMAATIAVALSTQRSDGWYRRRENGNMAILVVLMVVGTAVMTTIWKYRRQAVADSGKDRTQVGGGAVVGRLARGTEEGRGGAARSRVTVIGLMVFYVCGSLLDLLNVIAQSNCTSMQSAQCPTFR